MRRLRVRSQSSPFGLCPATNLAGLALTILVAPALLAQSRPTAPRTGWTRVATPWPERQACEAVEPDGAVIAIASTDPTRLVRRRGSARERMLEQTSRGGTGVVRALAIGPLGTTYVGAQHGLFLVHPSVENVDAVELGDGAPRGDVVGLHSDRADRLWIATTDEFGCVHTSQWFGRTHGRDDGVPEPPYLDLTASGDGTLLLRSADGVFAYRPDPAAPRMREARLAGGIAADGLATLVLDGDGAEADAGLVRDGDGSSLTFRWRAASHHMLRSLDDRRLQLPHPGSHHLLVYAFDRDLDRSRPLELEAHVPYRNAYRPRVLLPVAAAAAFAILALHVRHARRARLPPGRGLIGGCLAIVVLLQLIAAILDHGRSYPFIGFGMYREVYREGDVLYAPALLQLRDGPADASLEVPVGSLAFATDGAWRHAATLLFAEDAEREAYLRELPGAAPASAYELRVRRCRLTAEGPRQVAPLVLLRHELAPSAASAVATQGDSHASR